VDADVLAGAALLAAASASHAPLAAPTHSHAPSSALHPMSFRL
jgi:hypothetical protein